MAFSILFHLLNILILVSFTEAAINPFSPKASLLRNWQKNFPAKNMPEILLSKASPLNASQVAVYSRYIETHTLQNHILSFCTSGNLFCSLKTAGNVTRDVDGDADFVEYSNKQFARYQKGGVFGGDTFKNYSVGENVAKDTFSRYGKDSNGGFESFGTYADNTNVAGSGFGSYAEDGNGVISDFTSYGSQSNIQSHGFKTYGSESSATTAIFTSYSENSNVVDNNFRTYGSEANDMSSRFSAYSTQSNIVTNDFKLYDHAGNGAINDFSRYSGATNVARSNFHTYNDDGNAGIEQFSNYAEGAAQPENSFTSYGKGTNGPGETFTNYGNSTFPSTDVFKEYGKDAAGTNSAGFSQYSSNATFKEYFKSDTTFQEYANGTSGSASRKFLVEPGKFFRQETLLTGQLIPMPDIRDKMPERSFLPRILADKLPFSISRLPELIEALAARELKGVMAKTLSECERPAVKDETKRCVTSIEGMTEFAASVLGKTASVSTTANTAGSGETLTIGKVAGRNGGQETLSVSCHQSLFPYMVYYCHMVPRVKVFDAELLDEKSGKKVNDGVAICHLDTTQWSETHAAFLALGSKPGEIEVCHWIFENDLIWVAQD